MQKNADLYNFTQNLQGLMFQAAATQFMTNLSDDEKANRPTPPTIMQLRGGYAESPGWVMVQVAEFDPEPLTVEKFRKRAIFSAPRLVQALLELLMSEGWLDRQGDAYVFTAAGRGVMQRRSEMIAEYFKDFQPIDLEKIQRLLDLMTQVIDSCMQAENNWCLTYSRRRAPSADAAIGQKLIQCGSDFNAFRDDAHMAAYNAHNIPGYEWEAFNFIANEQADSAETLFEQLSYRGWTTGEWQMMLDNLARRDLLTANDEMYSVTDTGKTILADVEAKTDAAFFAPWDVLPDSDYDELIALMNAMQTACQAIINA